RRDQTACLQPGHKQPQFANRHTDHRRCHMGLARTRKGKHEMSPLNFQFVKPVIRSTSPMTGRDRVTGEWVLCCGFIGLWVSFGPHNRDPHTGSPKFPMGRDRVTGTYLKPMTSLYKALLFCWIGLVTGRDRMTGTMIRALDVTRYSTG